jgi:heme-degrading monooxygenase HmoA
MDPEDRRNLLSVLLAALTTLLSCVSTRRNHSMPAAAHTPAEHQPKPSIARIWRGRVKRERADEYEEYNFETGVRPLIQKALGVQCFREDREAETEFVTISYWENVEAMSRFTGGDPTKIHHLPRDPEFLIEVPKSVQILRIYESHGRIG